MDRKPIGGIVNKQRDSSSFLSILSFSWNEGFLRRRETLDRTFVFFTANCGYTSIEVSVFQTTKIVFEKERSMLTFGTKKQRPYRWRVRWSDGGKGLTVFPDFLSPPSMTNSISLYHSLSLFSLSATYVSLNRSLGLYIFFPLIRCNGLSIHAMIGLSNILNCTR